MRAMGDAIGDVSEHERARIAVSDAILAMLQKGHSPMETDLLVATSGITMQRMSEVFVDADDIRKHVVQRFKDRFHHLYLMEGPAAGPLDDRLRVFVDTRIRMMSEVGQIVAFARARALDHKLFGDGLARMRELLREQVRYQFSLELHDLTEANSEALVSIVDTFASPEAWDVLQSGHHRTQRQIRLSWMVGLRAIFEAWEPSQLPSLSDLLMVNRRSLDLRDP